MLVVRMEKESWATEPGLEEGGKDDRPIRKRPVNRNRVFLSIASRLKQVWAMLG